ncbi:MAG: UDP-galactopyranose mutase [Bacteroidota bacterium]
MKYDVVIVGAGLCGCVFAERIATQLHKRVLIIEKRNHIGGNCYDYYNSDGILVHKYGPHWFHTDDHRVFEYLSKFTDWRMHDHVVKSSVEGKLYPFPVNIDTLKMMYNVDLRSDADVEAFYESVRAKDVHFAKNAEEAIISKIGWDLYNKFFKNYTIKQWNLHPTMLEASVTSRIPVRYDNDPRYFKDKYQALPDHGYTKMFQNMVNHENITMLLETDYKEIIDRLVFDFMIYTGSPDHFFDYKFGRLPYRSLHFEHETLPVEYFQPCQQVNYPNDHDFTRIVEWKHATGQISNKTTITREYPIAHDDSNEKLYPIPTSRNQEIFNRYKQAASQLTNVRFCGRLADYRYYNMDQVVARALSIFSKEIQLVAA